MPNCKEIKLQIKHNNQVLIKNIKEHRMRRIIAADTNEPKSSVALLGYELKELFFKFSVLHLE